MAQPIWPFDQPPNSAVFTLRSIVFGGAPILYVSHDEDDHGWQFLSGGAVSEAEAALVALDEVIQRDATLVELADLAPGWIAWRTAADAPWQRGPHP